MSRTAVVLSLGTIRRVALDSSRAQEFYLRYPKRSGQLVLVAGDRVTFGRGVFLAVPLAIVHALADYARQIFAIVFKHLSGKARRIDGEEL